ncbi:glycosyltransferase family 4 protein [Salinibacter ruber]|uniref:glycosyltransferase family 4 protein n=1 Tax=Salinibacter ruber TaxID=146919 RepID=UPI0027E0AAA1|nr:glycosyltransferase family 4 protein [Salinibacter ruber]
MECTESSRCRILLISPSFARGKGGIENLMWRVRKKSRHMFTVLTQDPAPEPQDRSMQVTRLRGALQVTKFYLEHRHRYDAVYVSSGRIAHLLLIPWLIGTSTIVHAHGSDILFNPTSVKTYIRALLSRFLLRRATRVIAVSQWTKSQIIDESSNDTERSVTVVPNGVSVGKFQRKGEKKVRNKLGIIDEDFLLCTVARLDPRKGHRLILRALPDLPNCKYLIVGSGPYENQLRKIVRENDLEERVIMTGFVPDKRLPDVYDACDLFVMPSEHLEESNNVEGFGISFLEANAAGKAVVGTSTGGIPTAVNHEETGLLCEPNASSVREAILRLKQDDVFRKRIEQNARRWAQAHDWSQIVDRIDQIIDSAVANR